MALLMPHQSDRTSLNNSLMHITCTEGKGLEPSKVSPSSFRGCLLSNSHTFQRIEQGSNLQGFRSLPFQGSPVANYRVVYPQRRARDSNPQPYHRRLFSRQLADHSPTLHMGDHRLAKLARPVCLPLFQVNYTIRLVTQRGFHAHPPGY